MIKERNKPMQPIQKPKSAPFFLQWRAGKSLTNDVTQSKEKKDDDEWEAAWDDDSDEEDNDENNNVSEKDKAPMVIDDETNNQPKKTKITHSRSELVSILLQCHENKTNDKTNYQPVTKFLLSLGGPSAIDLALSSLCYGTHDIENGPALQYLNITMQYFIEAIQSKEDYEVINAYLHRFLYLHGSTIMNQLLHCEGEERLVLSMKELRKEHCISSKKLYEKCQYTLCLLRHFLQMV